jgi:hypothetical protein
MAAWVQATGEDAWTTSCDMAWGGGKECSAFADDMGANTQWMSDTGYYKRTRNCNEGQAHLCPVDCVANPWQPWSACTATCGEGSSTRTRTVKIANANGGKACENHCVADRAGCTTSGLHKQTSTCNTDVSCSKFDLPTCQASHVHCEIKKHSLNAPEKHAWMTSIDSKGKRYYHNTVTSVNTYTKPANFVMCGKREDVFKADSTTKRALGTKADEISPYQTHGRNTITHFRTGSFAKPVVDKTCFNNQNCGLSDASACHGCDTEQECKDMGISSTLFVTHHRAHMKMTHFNRATGKHEQAQYHCRREGATGCKCTCNGHTPCVVHQGKLLSNQMLHANSYPSVPTLQDCCNMCTNHPKCGSWEYSSTKVCVLKSGAPQFVDAASASTSITVWSGCRAGETC